MGTQSSLYYFLSFCVCVPILMIKKCMKISQDNIAHDYPTSCLDSHTRSPSDNNWRVLCAESAFCASTGLTKDWAYPQGAYNLQQRHELSIYYYYCHCYMVEAEKHGEWIYSKQWFRHKSIRVVHSSQLLHVCFVLYSQLRPDSTTWCLNNYSGHPAHNSHHKAKSRISATLLSETLREHI